MGKSEMTDTTRWCPKCALVGQHRVMSVMHWQEASGAQHAEYSCQCGHTSKVTVQP